MLGPLSLIGEFGHQIGFSADFHLLKVGRTLYSHDNSQFARMICLGNDFVR